MGKLKRFIERVRGVTTKYKKQIVGMTLALMVSGVGISVYATQYTTILSPSQMPYKLAGHATGMKKGISGDYYAYCTTPDKVQPTGQDYTDGSQVDDVTYTLLGWGFPNYHYTGNDEADYFITQAALWNHLYGYSTDASSITITSYADTSIGSTGVGSPAAGHSSITRDLLAECIQNLVTSASNNPHREGGNLYLDPKQAAVYTHAESASVPEGFLGTQFISLKADADRWVYPKGVTLSFTQNDVGAKFILDGSTAELNSVNDLKLGQKFWVKYPDNATSNGATVGWKITGPSTVWKSCLSTPNSGDAQDLAIVWEGTEDVYAEGFCTKTGTPPGDVPPPIPPTTEQPPGGVKLKKTDADTGKPLGGATFNVHNKSGSYNQTRTTDIEGKAEWKDIPVAVPVTSTSKDSGSISNDTTYQGTGTIITPIPAGANDFVMTEVSAPDGYQVDKTEQSFSLGAGQATVKDYSLTNKKKTKVDGWIQINKHDPAGVPLEGVGFAVIDENGKTVQTGKTDRTGYLKFEGLEYKPDGTKYTVKETAPIAGYAFIADDKVVTFKTGSNSASWNIQNNKKYYQGSVVITKTDKDSTIPLPGASIALFDSTGKKMGQKVTGGDGKVIFDNLDLGEYWYQEVTAPSGYQLDNTKYKLEVTERHLDAEAVLPNKKYGSVDIYKVDADGTIPLVGVKFGLYDSNKTFIKDGVTAGNGHVVFDELPIGKYYVKELVALPGYILDNNYYEVDISDTHRFGTFTLQNKKYGAVLLHKTDDVGNPLSGASFQLYDRNMQAVGSPKISQGNGEIIWDHIELGQYYVKEVGAPKGYQIMNAIKGIEITESRRTGEIWISNQIIYGSLTIVKTNENGHALRNAQFTIYNDQGIAIETKNTTTNGTVIFEHLPLGYYTIKETNPPEGYVPLKDTVEIKGDEIMNCEITMRHLDQEIKLANKPIVGSVKIVKVDSTDKHKLAGAIFALYDDEGHEIASTRTDDWGNAGFSNIQYGKYTMKEVAVPIGYETTDQVWDVNIYKDKQVIEYTIENKPITYRVHVDKDDVETSKPLEGAEFQLWQWGSPLSYNGKTTYTSNAQGDVDFPFNLQYGDYQVVETKAPYGYIKSDPLNIKLNETTPYTKDSTKNRVVFYTMHNQSKRTTLKITKLDEQTGLPLQNAKYEVWNEDQTQVLARGETGDTGIVIFPLRLGTYWYKEVEAPEGYQIDNTFYKVEFTDTSDGLTIAHKRYNKTVESKPPGGDVVITPETFPSVQITKLDVSTGTPLPNAGFVIYAEDGTTVVKRGMTDDDGIVTFQLNKGTFYYQEFQAPNGYAIDNQKYKFILEANNQILKCEMTNKKDVPPVPDVPKTPDVPRTPDTPKTPETPTVPSTPTGEVDIAKTDVSTGALLPNATFFIYGADQETVVVKGTTDETGIVRFKLPVGDYYYQEFSAPDGYEVDNSKFPFAIKANGEIVKCQMTDVPKSTPSLPKTLDVVKTNLPITLIGIGLLAFAGISLLMVSKGKRKRHIRR